jgi:hypothetical protein
MNLAELKQDENLKVLVYGPSGTAKTTFATSFPGPMYVHDFDGKLISAANHWRRVNKPERLSDINYFNYNSLSVPHKDQMTAEEETAKKRYGTYYGWIVEHQQLAAEGKFPYKTVVLDSLTRYAEVLLREILRQTRGKINPPIEGMHNIPGKQTFMVNQTYFKTQLDMLLALPCNIVVCAHLKTKEDELTGRIKNVPFASGNMADYLPVVFGEVYRSYVEAVTGGGVKYMLQTQSSSDFNCRTQLGLKASIENGYENLLVKSK